MRELDLHGNVVGPKGLRALVNAVAVNRKIEKISIPEPGPLLPVRARRYHATLLRLLGKLVQANGRGANWREKHLLRRRYQRRHKARRQGRRPM